MKLITQVKSTIKRAKRGYAFKQSTWGSGGESSNSHMAGVESSGQSLGAEDRPLQVHPTQPFEHITVSQSGNPVRTVVPCVQHVGDVTVGGLDAPTTEGFQTLLPPPSAPPSNTPLTSTENHGKGRKHSLLPYEFSISRFDDHDTLSPDPTAGDDAQVPLQKRPTPATLQKEWVLHYREDYLREMIRLEGRGSSGKGAVCECGADGSYRCKSCVGAEVRCRECMVATHRQDPFHFIEEWNGHFFQDTTLKKIGLRIQLGHPSHSHCPASDEARRSRNDDFVILDLTGIHEVGLDFCECESKRPYHIQLLRHQLFPGTPASPRSAVTFRSLKFFQILSFESKGSQEEFYNTLVRLTTNVDPKSARDRYHEFLVVVSEWRHLKMLKRAGRGHDMGGVRGTGPGDCAIRCPACPQPGINLPLGWENLGSERSWLYRLFVAIDGNFRLKRRMVSSDERDPGLNDGWAYFVNEILYKAHLVEHWNTAQDKSTCVAHDAVDKPDREARGLAASGVVVVVCSRHEIRLPNGMGDLQKGERYINVDYIAFSGIRWFKIREIVISYDIACQWHKRLIERLGLLPDDIQPSWISRVVFAIPKFHLPAHIDSCNRTFSLNLIKGVGRTDGEAPERGWSRMNGIAKSTAEMGPGNRRDTLDDHLGDANFEKVKQMGRLLLTKMIRALLGREKHHEVFVEYTGSIPPDFVSKWTQQVEIWEASPSVAHNPYEQEVQGVSEKQIRLDLAREAAETEKTGVNNGSDKGDEGDDIEDAARGIHPSLFIAQGLQLEDDQRKLVAALALLGNHPTAKQLSTMAERSNTLRRRISAWIEIQKVFMPDAAVERLQHQLAETAIDGNSAKEAFDIPLLLPSSLPLSACPPAIRTFEAKLREGQAYDALAELRRYLRLRSYLYKRKDRYSRGVAQNTRSNTAIKRSEAGVAQAQFKYGVARGALVNLCGETTPANRHEFAWRNDLLVLKASDVRGLSEGLFGESEGSRTMSWLWLRTKDNLISEKKDDDIENDVQLQDVLRVEFLRCRARAMRWAEEVELVDEEMRRTLVSFAHKSEWWSSRTVSTIPDVDGSTWLDPDYVEGFSAYALSQAAVYGELFDRASNIWAKGADDAMKKAAAEQLDEDDDE